MRPEWRQYCRNAFVQLRYLALVVPTSLFVFMLNPDLPADQRWRTFLISNFFGVVCYLSIWSAYLVVYAQKTREFIRTGKFEHVRLRTHLAVNLVAMPVGMAVAFLAREAFEGRPVRLPISYIEAIGIGTPICVAWVFFFGYRSTKERYEELKTQATHAELDSLKNQMRPHFLFNSLNSLASLIDENPGRAAEMTQRLSDLYRKILAASKSASHPLSSELDLVENYLDLEKIRFGERLKFKIDCDPRAQDLQIPGLLLQTLAENAVKHGISPSREGGEMVISVTPKMDAPGSYWIALTNPRPASGDAAEAPGSRTGLANTRERLDLFFGQGHDFKLTQTTSETCVSFIARPRVTNAFLPRERSPREAHV